MSAAALRVGQLAGFDDQSVTDEAWQRLLRRGPSDVVFLTRAYLRIWWECFGRGRLLLLTAERGAELVALAPLFADQGMVYLVGSGGSDYLDFLGDTSAPGVLEALLAAAREQAPDFAGFCFYHLVEGSPTPGLLAASSQALGLELAEHAELEAPCVELARDTSAHATLARRARALAREGPLAIEHLREPARILPHLDELFEQHRKRWAGTPHPSLFEAEAERRFYRGLCAAAPATGVLFSRLLWQERAVALHLGFLHGDSLLWYKPSYDPALAARSPGSVLFRELVLEARRLGLRTLDLGLGDEPFKARFATARRRVRSLGLYPKASTGTGRQA